MLEITEFTEARIDVQNRREKHGDEDVPAVTITAEITAANTMLDLIDPGIRQALYKAKPDATPELPGVEESTPVLRCNSFDQIPLTQAYEGWRLLVDDNLDDTTPMEFSGVKVDKMRVDAKQGGSIVLKLRLGTSDVDADKLGKLGMHNGQAIWLQLLKPEKAPDKPVIDGSVEAFKRDHPDATDLFSAGADAEPGPEDEGDEGEGSDPDAEAAADEQPAEAVRGENWPFGAGSGTEPGPGETNSAESETAAFEAGAAQAVAEAGLHPKGRRARRAAVGAVE